MLIATIGAGVALGAVAGRWSYRGGPASWSPKVWRAGKLTGLALVAGGLLVALVGLVVG
jgi:hypothetical protein